jgi:hypothetical protein
MEVTDYLGAVHTLNYVSEPSQEQKEAIIYSYTLEAKNEKDKNIFKLKLEHSKYMVDEIIYLLSKKNSELGKDSAFIVGMFQALIPIKEMLNAGSYTLARSAISQAQAAYGSDYTAIFQDVIDDIDEFNSEHGL